MKGDFISRMTISEDGKSLTDEIVENSDDDKKTTIEKDVFRRVSTS